VLAPVPAHAADGPVVIGDTRVFETYATNPAAYITYQAPAPDTPAAPSPDTPETPTPDAVTITVQQYSDGMWVQYSKLEGAGRSGRINLFQGKEYETAGTYIFRLSMDNNPAVSPNVTVSVKKSPTGIGIGMLQHTGAFHTTGFVYSANELYYQADKEIKVFNLDASVATAADIDLQRYDNQTWTTLERKQVSSPKEIEQVAFSIKQYTPETKYYRISVPETSYVTGGISEIFTVAGETQTPGLSVRYSGKQRYKKTSMKLVIKTAKAFTGKAVIFDGKKKIKTVAVQYGEGTAKLPKNLKKGTHKIKVQFVPCGEYKGFYRSVANTKNIKVTK
jgi:putative NIF3 family GTP cyclohydrolase 1 type 2